MDPKPPGGLRGGRTGDGVVLVGLKGATPSWLAKCIDSKPRK
jgi:hypothetical protein